jgi:uncharacterized protein with beta-barrel porin domain
VDPYFATFASTSYMVDGAVPGANAGRVELGLNWAMSSNVSAYASFIDTFGGPHVSGGSGMAGLRVGW